MCRAGHRFTIIETTVRLLIFCASIVFTNNPQSNSYYKLRIEVFKIKLMHERSSNLLYSCHFAKKAFKRSVNLQIFHSSYYRFS